MTPQGFEKWREKEVRLSQDFAAKLLGVTSRSINNWESGYTLIPQAVDLACRYLGGVFKVEISGHPTVESIAIGRAMKVASKEANGAARIVDQRGDAV